MSDKHNHPSPTSRPPTPGWVKAVLSVMAILLSVFVLLHVTGHGFGQHMEHMHR